MFRHFLGDRYDGSPLRGPINCNDAGGSSGQEKPSDQLEENRQANQQPDVSIVEKNDSVVKDAEKKSGDGNTQVQEFIKSVKKLRDSRESHTMTQQIPQCELNDPSSDTEEERPNGECHRSNFEEILNFYLLTQNNLNKLKKLIGVTPKTFSNPNDSTIRLAAHSKERCISACHRQRSTLR